VARHLHCDRLGNTCPVEVPEASTLCGLIHRVKLKRWLNTSPEVVHDAAATWGSFSATRAATHCYKRSTGDALNMAIDSLGYSCKAESRPCGSALLVVHHIKTVFCCNLAARNAPKCHSSRLCRAGVFVPVVARPIQDMSAVSITHKTVGIGLPRLRCGAIGWRIKLSIQSHQVQSWTR
jgi:hypothetical protein